MEQTTFSAKFNRGLAFYLLSPIICQNPFTLLDGERYCETHANPHPVHKVGVCIYYWVREQRSIQGPTKPTEKNNYSEQSTSTNILAGSLCGKRSLMSQTKLCHVEIVFSHSCYVKNGLRVSHMKSQVRAKKVTRPNKGTFATQANIQVRAGENLRFVRGIISRIHQNILRLHSCLL